MTKNGLAHEIPDSPLQLRAVLLPPSLLSSPMSASASRRYQNSPTSLSERRAVGHRMAGPPGKAFIGQVVFKNVGKLPATEFVSVVKKIEVHDADWATPVLTDRDLPIPAGVIPVGAEVPQGSPGIAHTEVAQAHVSGDKYLFVYGRAKFKDGFGIARHVNFCHRYPWAQVQPLTPSGYRISKSFARYHQRGNNSD